MESTFAEGFYHKPHTILGVRLSPFNLRHFFLLELFGNPFLTDWQKASPHDLLQAVLICSTDGMGPCNLRASGWRRLRAIVECDWRARKLFKDYLDDYSSGPPVLPSKKNGSPKIPWQLFIVSRLVRFGHISPRAAWTMPYSEAAWLSVALHECDPQKEFSIELLSGADLEAIKKAGFDEKDLV